MDEKIEPIRNINRALLEPGEVPLWANDLRYQYVMDAKLDKPRSVKEIIGYDPVRIFKLREQAQAATDDAARFRCISCGCPLNILHTKDRGGFYFKHKRHIESCPIKDEQAMPPNVLKAKKFNGQQESAAHEFMKTLLYRLLVLDPRFSDETLDTRRNDSETKDWRKPDVGGVFQDKKVVFEIQLSTELLEVIRARREFYIRNNTLLVWVFQEFSFDKARASDLDILNSNNNNIIVLSEEAVDISLDTGELHLSCRWQTPALQEGSIHRPPDEGIFNFSDLIKDYQKSQIYHYDFEKNDTRIKQELFSQIWKEEKLDQWDDKKAADIIKKCLGLHIESPKNLARYLHMLWVAKTGEKSGWEYSADAVLHKLYDRYPEFVFLYLCAFDAYARNIPDKNGKVAPKRKIIESSLAAHATSPSPYFPNQDFEEVVQVLFPEAHQHCAMKLDELTSK